MEELDLAAALELAWSLRIPEGGAVVITVVASHLSDVTVGTRLVIGAQAGSEGTLPSWLLPHVLADARSALVAKASEMRSYVREGDGAGHARLQHGELDVFFEVIAEPPHLVIVGSRAHRRAALPHRGPC